MIPPRWLLALAVALTPALAVAAPSPIAVLVGPELREPLSKPDVGDLLLDENANGGEPVGVVVAAVAYRLPYHLTIGMRGSVSWRRYASSFAGTINSEHHSYRAIPVDAALTLQYEPGRWLGKDAWISPWLGRRFTRLTSTDTPCVRASCFPASTTGPDWRSGQTVFGLTAGLDVLGPGPNRLAVFVDLLIGTRDASAVQLGLGYRH